MVGFKPSFSKVFWAVMFFVVYTRETEAMLKIFNVLKYGGVADGKTDNSKAFLKAWDDACQWRGRARVLIPRGKYKLQSVKFLGPCEGSITFVIKGLLLAPTDLSTLFTDTWINFRYVDKLTVSGGGTLDGRGAIAWPRNDCERNPNCRPLPTTMRFDFVSNSRVHHIRSIDSKNNHFMVYGCNKMNFTHVRISAPANSPNTDGIKIGSSNRIRISHTVIGTGDDCISIISGSRKIRIYDVVCGPGHGISVGSLGKYKDEDDVMGVKVKNCTFNGTSDGVRIKTWASTMSLMASNFTYEDIRMHNVGNPIIIDQEYCPQSHCNQMASSHVQIANVKYKNISGSSRSKVAVTLRCSKSYPCKNIVMENIDLRGQGKEDKVSSSCSYVNGFSLGHQSPPSCLSYHA